MSYVNLHSGLLLLVAAECVKVHCGSFSELDLGQVDIDATGVQSITSFLSSSRSISILLLQETGIQNVQTSARSFHFLVSSSSSLVADICLASDISGWC